MKTWVLASSGDGCWILLLERSLRLPRWLPFITNQTHAPPPLPPAQLDMTTSLPPSLNPLMLSPSLRPRLAFFLWLCMSLWGALANCLPCYLHSGSVWPSLVSCPQSTNYLNFSFTCFKVQELPPPNLWGCACFTACLGLSPDSTAGSV